MYYLLIKNISAGYDYRGSTSELEDEEDEFSNVKLELSTILLF